MRALLPSILIATTLFGCASSPLSSLPSTPPATAGSEIDEILSATLRAVLSSPYEDLEAIASERRVPVGAMYFVREGEGWARVPVEASALPSDTGREFVLVGDDAPGLEGRSVRTLSLTVSEVVGDTAVVHAGQRLVGVTPEAAAHPYGSHVGRLVRDGGTWRFDGWHGWIGA